MHKIRKMRQCSSAAECASERFVLAQISLLLAAQTVEYKLLASLNALNVAQSLIIFSGLAAGKPPCTEAAALGLGLFQITRTQFN